MTHPPTTRNTVPRLILILGCRCAGDMLKALTLDEIDATFARAVARIASKQIKTKKLWHHT